MTLHPPYPCEGLDKNGEIIHVVHVRLAGQKHYVVASTSTGTVISWNLGSGVKDAPGITIGLVVHPIPVTNVVVHNSMVVSMCFQPEGYGSKKNLLGISTLDGKVLVLNADRIGKALINQQLESVICTSMLFYDHVLFVGTSDGMMSCLSLASEGLQLFEIDVRILLDDDLTSEKRETSTDSESIRHLTRASNGRLVCTCGQVVRVWDVSQFPAEFLPTQDAEWLEFCVPHAQFQCSLDSGEVETLIFDDDEGKNMGILFLGGTRILQVYSIDGAMLGQFGDRYTWSVDNLQTFRHQKPHEYLQITEHRQPWQKEYYAPPSLNEKEDEYGDQQKTSLSSHKRDVQEPHHLRKPERSKDLHWNLKLRSSRRRLKGFNVQTVIDTAARVKAEASRRNQESDEWARNAFGKK